MSEETFRGYFDVWALSLAVMNGHKQSGTPINEGIAFEVMKNGY